MYQRAGGISVGVDVALGVLFRASEKGEVAVVIEVGARDEDGATDGTAGVDLPIRILGLAGSLAQRIGGIQLVGSCVGIQLAVVLVASGLGDRADDDRAVGYIGTEVRDLDLDLGDLIVVHILDGGAIVAGIGDVGAIKLEADSADRVAIGGVVAEGSADVDLGGIVGRVGDVAVAAGDGEARERLEELGDVAAFDGEVLDLLGGNQIAALAGIEWDIGLRRDADRLRGASRL